MEKNEIIRKIADLQELKRLKEELQAEIDKASDEIKLVMGDKVQETFGPYKVTYKTQVRKSIDSKALQADFPDIAERYTVETPSRPLRIY